MVQFAMLAYFIAGYGLTLWYRNLVITLMWLLLVQLFIGINIFNIFDGVLIFSLGWLAMAFGAVVAVSVLIYFGRSAFSGVKVVDLLAGYRFATFNASVLSLSPILALLLLSFPANIVVSAIGTLVAWALIYVVMYNTSKHDAAKVVNLFVVSVLIIGGAHLVVGWQFLFTTFSVVVSEWGQLGLYTLLLVILLALLQIPNHRKPISRPLYQNAESALNLGEGLDYFDSTYSSPSTMPEVVVDNTKGGVRDWLTHFVPEFRDALDSDEE